MRLILQSLEVVDLLPELTSRRTAMALDAEQRGILRQSALAILAAGFAMIAGYLWLPGEPLGVTESPGSGDRIAFALKWDLPVFLWLAGCLRAVASGRFREPADRKGSAYGEPTPGLAVRIAILQNTLEQTVLAVGSHLLLAAVLRGAELVLIPVSVAVYLVGRAAFAIAYRHGAVARAFGMALTATPIIAGFVLAAFLITAGR
ncbi:MAG: MAPEG family protein [Sphingomonas sp.]|nr:MAPEG family protein [Sphingomonas sp.]